MSETTPGRLESSLAGRDGRDGDGALAAGPAPPPAPALARALAVVTRRTCFATWEPRRRTHLLCVLCAGLLTYASYGAMYPLRTEWLWYELAGGIGLGLLSVWPLIGSALNLLVTCVFYATVPGGDPFPLPIMGPWLCAAVLLTRGFNRLMAYGLVAVSTTVELFSRMTSPGYAEDQDVQPALMLGVVCLIIAELMRRPRQQADAVADRYRADLERQRLLVVSELHDTVVRDLTQAVMLAEQARLAQPDAVLGRDLAALTASVRTSVEQLRSSLRAMSDAGGRTGAQGLDVLASSAPRPLPEVIAEARAVLAQRRITLETEGLEMLDAEAVSPGVRQQLVRVLGELAANMAKYAEPGSARIVVDSDGRTLEAMATNAISPNNATSPNTPADPANPGSPANPINAAGPADPASPVSAGAATSAGSTEPAESSAFTAFTRSSAFTAGRTAPASSDVFAASSGLGLTGARRRVESLGGTFAVTRTAERFTAVLSVPLSR